MRDQRRFSITEVGSLAVIGAEGFSGLSTSRGGFLCFERLCDLETDPRWNVRYIIVSYKADVQLVVPLYESRPARWLNPFYDVSRVPSLQAFPSDPRRWLFVGGCSDLACAIPRAIRRDAKDLLDAAAAAGQMIREQAARDDKQCVAMYVMPEELPVIDEIIGDARVQETLGQNAWFDMRRMGDSYLGSLRSSQRRTVKRDWDQRIAAGIETSIVAWDDVASEAAPLIAAVSQRHGMPDHPSLVNMRLDAWMSYRELECLTFAVHAQGRLVGVSFGWIFDGILQVQEVGLADAPQRHLAYVETLIYAPLRTAASRGCESVQLGPGSSLPKVRRGAQLSEMVVVAGSGAR